MSTHTGPRIALPRFPTREPLKADSKLPLVGRYCVLVASLLTFIVAMIHLCTLPVSLAFPGEGASFVDDTNKYSFRLSLFSLTPQTLIDAWTPFAFFLVSSLGHTEQFRCDFALKNFLRYSVFHFLMVMFGNFPYAGGIGIVFGIINFVMLPFFVTLAIIAPAEEVSFNVYLGFKDAVPANEAANPVNNVASKTVGGTNPVVNNRTGDFPVVNRATAEHFPPVYPVQGSNPGGYHSNPLAQYGASGLHISNSSKGMAPNTGGSSAYYDNSAAAIEVAKFDNNNNVTGSNNGMNPLASRANSNVVYATNSNSNNHQQQHNPGANFNGTSNFNAMHNANSLQQQQTNQAPQDHGQMQAISQHSSHLHHMQQQQAQQQKPSNSTVYGMAMTGF